MISRRSLLLLIAAPLLGDERSEIVEWLGKFAGYLTQDNPESFLRACAKDLRGQIETNLRALVNNNEVASSISVLSIAGEGDKRQVELDWYLQLAPKGLPASSVRRRERLKLTIERVKKGWSVLEMDPVTLFQPPA